jgi:hypothetical protein
MVGRGEVIHMADGEDEGGGADGDVVGRGAVVGMADGEDEGGEEDGDVVGRGEVVGMVDGEDDGDRVGSCVAVAVAVAVGTAEFEGIGDGAWYIVGEVVGEVEILLGGGSSSTRSIDLEVKEHTKNKKGKVFESGLLISIGMCALSPRQH